MEQLGELDATAAPLLAGLCAFLRQRQRGVQEIELRFEHRESPATRLRLRFAEPVADPVRITRLLGERLARITLPEPVRALRIRSGALLELRAEPHALFAMDRRRADSGVPQLVERLQARLGADAVYGLRLVPNTDRKEEWRTVPISRKPGSEAEHGGEMGADSPLRGRCGCSRNRRHSVPGSRGSRVISSSKRIPSASRAAGGTAAT